MDRQIKATNQLNHATAYEYDLAGNVAAVVDGSRGRTEYAYDGLGRVTSVTDGEGGVVAYAYDAVGNLTSAADASGTVVFAYDALYRAAQFAPFKALSGYEDEVKETARLTDARVEPDAERIAQLDARLRLLAEHLAETPVVSITYFRPDARKDGGSYETVSGAVKKLDTLRRAIVLRDGREIRIDDVAELGGALFAAPEG